MDAEARTKAAIDFLTLAASGKADVGAKKHLVSLGTHHNVHFPAGWPALVQAMQENARQFPQKRLEVKRVVVDGDEVVVLSHVVHKPGGPQAAVVHWFRFIDDKIVELWDVGQALPNDSPNRDGAF